MTDTKTITKPEVIEALERLVARHGPDTVYKDRDLQYDRDGEEGYSDACRNVDEDGKPLCIVGTYLVEELGIDGKEILRVGDEGEGVDALRANEDNLYPEFTDGAYYALKSAQTAQDSGKDWGTALERAKNGVEE